MTGASLSTTLTRGELLYHEDINIVVAIDMALMRICDIDPLLVCTDGVELNKQGDWGEFLHACLTTISADKSFCSREAEVQAK